MATYPLTHYGRILSGPQDHQTRQQTFNNWESRNAVDILTNRGTPVIATHDGIIGNQFGPMNTNNNLLLGNRLHLVTNDNELYYAHLDKIADGIVPGTQVKEGTILGWSGGAGDVDHLHLGVRNGDPTNFINGLTQPSVINFDDADIGAYPEAHVIDLQREQESQEVWHAPFGD